MTFNWDTSEEEIALYLTVLAERKEEEENPLGISRTKPANDLPFMSHILEQCSTQIDSSHFEHERLDESIKLFSKVRASEEAIAKAIFDEARHSNHIENIYDEDQDEALATLLTHIWNTPFDKLSLELISEFDKSIANRGIRKRGKGKVRIANKGRVVFTPPDNCKKIMELLEDWLSPRTPSNQSKICVHLGVSHYQFESIHPFYDGNGRIGRALLLCYFRHLTGATMIPAISKHIYKNKQDYYSSLNAPRFRGDFIELCSFIQNIFQDGIAESYCYLSS
tara:strand:+ start:8925 stop:9764 length:840 start_codon:yes stop_codon:yes gene_type:complete